MFGCISKKTLAGLWRKAQSFITGNMTGGILMHLILWLRSMLPPQNEVTQYFLIKGTKTMWNIMSRVSKIKGCQRLRTALLPDSRPSFLWLFLHLLHKAPYLCNAYYLECQLFAPCRQGILQEKMLQCLVLDGHFYDPLPHWFCSVVFFLQLSSCSKPVPIPFNKKNVPRHVPLPWASLANSLILLSNVSRK